MVANGSWQFLSLLPKGSLVLDVGCGAGIKTKYIHDRGYRIVGIDFSENMIALAHDRAPDLEFHVLDIEDVNKLPESFDGIFAQAILLHIEKAKIRKVLEKLVGKLNYNGLLYVAVKGARPGGAQEQIVKENDYGYEYERFFSYYSTHELKTYFSELGLEIVWEYVAQENSQWIQIIGKKIAK